jgi:hypothetical protein
MLQESFDVAVDHAAIATRRGAALAVVWAVEVVAAMNRRAWMKTVRKSFIAGLGRTAKAAMVADSRGEAVHGLACAAASAFCIACNSFNTSRSLGRFQRVGPVGFGSFGLS